jgi:hypothetical protein
MKSLNTLGRSKAPLTAACVALMAIGPLSAADGQFEINQACVAGGCFPGDDPGFPVTIINTGSYILTSNLDVRDETDPEDVTAIYVTDTGQRGVDIDLNGFRIIGPTTCTGFPVTSCTPTGLGNGVQGLATLVTVRNGTIYGMGEYGVDLNSGARVVNLQVAHCGTGGIGTGNPGNQIVNNFVRQNGVVGIGAGNNSLVIGNLIHANGSTGLGGGATMGYVNNVITDNAVDVDGGINLGGNLCTDAVCP